MPPANPAVFTLRKPLERALRDGHPWVYRDAVSGSASPGSITTLVDSRGAFVARGVADDGPIALRVFTLRDELLSEGLIAARIAHAAELRRRVVAAGTDAFRLVHGEGDRMPGFVCDVYGRFAVLKTDGAGALALRDTVVSALRPILAATGVDTLLLRASGRARRDRVSMAAEAPKTTLAFGTPPPDKPISVREHGMTLLVDLMHGQKTGLFLDQRESRARVRALAAGMRVLNLYAYTGGFSVAAGLGGALHVESVDVAPGAIALADQTWAANALAADRHVATVADVSHHLAARAAERSRYDLVIADPPSFAPREDLVMTALTSYRALHTAALGLVSAGGFYLAASCSSHVDAEAFGATVIDGARRARRTLQVVDAWGPPADHPRLPAFPEGDYLKVMLYRVQ